MSIVVILVVFLAKLVLFVLGLKIAFKSFRLSKLANENYTSLMLFGTGILLLTFGEVVEEILFEFTSQNISLIHIIEEVFNIFGFVLITLSIQKTRT